MLSPLSDSPARLTAPSWEMLIMALALRKYERVDRQEVRGAVKSTQSRHTDESDRKGSPDVLREESGSTV